MWIFLALVIVPIVEIALFIEVGGLIGLWPTLGIVVATALAGAALLRAQGFAAMSELQRRIDRGEDPTATIAHGALILVAGVVLLTPGFFTDAVGFLLLVPAVRAVVIRHAARRIIHVHMARRGGPERPREPGDETVEGDYEDVTPEPRGLGRRGEGR
jgi:UPF0716 protein FxsA